MIGAMSRSVTVAIPTLDAGPRFAATLAALNAQRVDAEVQLLVCDSGSTDDTVTLARTHGAEVLEIPRPSFSHGATRNLLMREARGEHVAFLTQDAVPADPGWLAHLLSGFALGQRVALVFGPYRPRPDASPMVARELEAWFATFSQVGAPRIDVLDPGRRDGPPTQFLGQLGYFTDANGCVLRRAWEEVPFRPVAYAEDHLLAQDMLRAGWAKVYVPDAAVIHSHDYSPGEWLRRSFDEARAVREVYGWALDPRSAARNVWGNVGADRRWQAHRRRSPALAQLSLLARSTAHHSARAVGTLLGGRSERLPRALTGRLSLERRG
jgi:GT2 family glycosyltransferase